MYLQHRYEHLRLTVKIVLVGKYTGLEDSYASVIKALRHSSLRAGRKLDLTVGFSARKTTNSDCSLLMFISCSLAQFVEATNLEQATLNEDPVKYHQAWQKVCGQEQTIGIPRNIRSHAVPSDSMQLCDAEGILVPGGFGNRGTEGKIAAAKWARTKKVPYLGVCLGLQVAVIGLSGMGLERSWHLVAV